MTLGAFMKQYMKHNQQVMLFEYTILDGYVDMKVLKQVYELQNGIYKDWEVHKILRVLKGYNNGSLRMVIKKPRKKFLGLF